jgi:hypothetical protein
MIHYSMATDGGSPDTRQIFLYFGSLTVLVYLLAAPELPLLDIPTSYMLKNQLHATAPQVSTFRLLVAIPVYVAFVFGLTRDLWNPFGLRDRGFFLLFAPLTMASFIWLALSRLSYSKLLIGMILAMLSIQFITAAYQGLIALIGQQKFMSGRLSALWNIFSQLPAIAAAFAAAIMSERVPPSRIFSFATVLALLIGLVGFWKPLSIFGHAYEMPQARGMEFLRDLKRLVKHRAIYPVVLINILWNFTPGASTPLQFYLTNHLHTSDAVYPYYEGIYLVSYIPTFLLYGFLCKKTPLNRLLWWATIIAVPQMIPLTFIKSGNLALLIAVPIGLMGGLASAAYYDLTIRCCPPGLQGTLMMLVTGVWVLALRGSDVLGSRIYAGNPVHGFLYCVIAMTAVYALILPLILFIPKQLIATADGEPNPGFGQQ